MKKNELFGHEVKKNESSFLVALGFRLEMLFVVFVCWLFEAVLLDVSTIDTTGLSGKKNRRPVLIFLEIHMIPNNQSIAKDLGKTQVLEESSQKSLVHCSDTK